MEFITSVTQKGQVTIPLKAREKLGIKTRGRVKLEIKKDHLRVTPAFTILDIAGTIAVRKNKGVDPLKAREDIENHYERG